MTITLFSANMTMPEALAPVMRTKLGQAHFAGTGPDGKTCRECAKWYNTVRGSSRSRPHQYRGDGGLLLTVEPAKCHHPILNKANRRVPHDAEACRLFVQDEAPPAAQRESLRKSKKGERA